MDIATGISALKAAVDLTRATRDAAKAGKLTPDEFAGRVGEIYDYIIDSKDALVDAKDEIQELKAKLKTIDDDTAFREQLDFDGARSIYFRKQSTPNSVPEAYCSTCLDRDNKRIRLTSEQGIYRCAIHGYKNMGY